MQSSTKLGIGVGIGVVVVGGVALYYFKDYRLPNMSGYQRLPVGHREYGVNMVQVRNPAPYLNDATATITNPGGGTGALISKSCGIIYVALGTARARNKTPFSLHGTIQYGVAEGHRSSTSVAWTITQVYLAGSPNTAGTITGGAACSS